MIGQGYITTSAISTDFSHSHTSVPSSPSSSNRGPVDIRFLGFGGGRGGIFVGFLPGWSGDGKEAVEFLFSGP